MTFWNRVIFFFLISILWMSRVSFKQGKTQAQNHIFSSNKTSHSNPSLHFIFSILESLLKSKHYNTAFYTLQASWVAQMVGKNLPPMRKAWVRSLCWEDSLEKGMATHSSVIVWRITGAEFLAGYCPWSHKKLDMTEQLTLYTLQLKFLKQRLLNKKDLPCRLC